MDWIKLTALQSLDELHEKSDVKPILIFKHSTRCMTSKMVLDRFERGWNDELSAKFDPVFLDIIQYRDISNAITEKYQVEHESPQVLIIKQGVCAWNASHGEIKIASLPTL